MSKDLLKDIPAEYRTQSLETLPKSLLALAIKNIEKKFGLNKATQKEDIYVGVDTAMWIDPRKTYIATNFAATTMQYSPREMFLTSRGRAWDQYTGCTVWRKECSFVLREGEDISEYRREAERELVTAYHRDIPHNHNLIFDIEVNKSYR